jgi:hypothetical protein
MRGGKPEIVKIKTVAERAGVSVATVSRVLNGNPTVAEDLAVRVQRAVEETGYRPNGIARSLRTRSTRTIALQAKQDHAMPGGLASRLTFFIMPIDRRGTASRRRATAPRTRGSARCAC